MCLSMVCPPSIHGVDVEKEQDLPLESFPKGWYLVKIVPEHSNGIHILFCFVELLWELFLNCLSLCYTLCMAGQGDIGFCKGESRGDGTQVCAPGVGTCSTIVYVSSSRIRIQIGA